MIKLKQNKAATMMDVIIGLLIIIIFTSILTSSFYTIYRHNISIRMNAVAVDYSIKILENIDRMTYEEVTNDINNTLTTNYNINENYQIIVDVENYNKNDETKEDIIKIITLTVKYTVFGEEQEYSIKKLKIKEM